MKVHQLIQGTPEWHTYRAQHFNASDAPAMMGVSPYKSRSDLVRELATGVGEEVTPEKQRIFDAGHRFEALARPLAEQIIGETLYPVTGSEGPYSASFDGITMLEDTIWEHKTLNDALRAVLTTDDAVPMEEPLPLMYRVQMEHQLMVSGATRCLFMASQWSRDGELIEERHCWYSPDQALRRQIIGGWAQLSDDIAAYVPEIQEQPKPIGRSPESLPALMIEVSGSVAASNLPEFKAVAMAAIASVNRDLKTDQDFADAEKSVKWCERVEDSLKAAKQHALSQTASIEFLFRTMDEIGAEAKRVRLDLEKLVKARKDAIRVEMVSESRAQVSEFIQRLNGELPETLVPACVSDFGAAIKGLRSIDSIREALGNEVARAKVTATEQANKIRLNLKAIGQCGSAHLFPDLRSLVLKDHEDLAAVIAKRISDESQRKAAAEQAAAQAIEAARKPETLSIGAQMARALRPELAAVEAAPWQMPTSAPVAVEDDNSPATLKLGAICERLGFNVTAQFLAELGIEHKATSGNAKLYQERDWTAICDALIDHITKQSESF